MIRRHTRLLVADRAGIHQAAAVLRAGGLVAFPTETVYGLGAHALDPQAVRGIFEAKARPADDPLIVHLAESSLLETVAKADAATWRLAEYFWPGPLTLVLPKRPIVPLEVTAGLDTVGVRVPDHPVASAILMAAELPVAAPSANLFGRPSPTRAAHVLEDLDGRIDLVVDGGPTSVGVESTIVDLSTTPPRLLRPGGVPTEELEAALGVHLATPTRPTNGPQTAPGMLPVHYSPQTPLTLLAGIPSGARDRLIREVQAALAAGQRVGVLALEEDITVLPSGARVEVVGTWSDPKRTAARLFQAVRALDAEGLDALFARELADPSIGLGRALADRLRRASRRVLDIQH
jgi:L-threonylcarbamoyladenylate synthase